VIAVKRLQGRRLTLLLTGAGEEDREEAVTFGGTVRMEGGGLVFVREGGGTVVLREQWLPRIEKVLPEARRWLLDADYVLRLEVGTLSDEQAHPDWLGIEVEMHHAGKRRR
jgi:hypothetical protein